MFFELLAQPEGLSTEPVPFFLQLLQSLLSNDHSCAIIIKTTTFLALLLDLPKKGPQFLDISVAMNSVLAIYCLLQLDIEILNMNMVISKIRYKF